MKSKIFIAIALLLSLSIVIIVLLSSNSTNAPDLENPTQVNGGGFELVQDGKANAVVVIPDNAKPEIQEAVESFVEVVRKSTSAQIRIVKESEVSDSDENRLYVGDTKRAASEGISSKQLEEEAFRIVAREREVFVVGRDVIFDASPTRLNPNSTATRWALNDILDRHVGVRWLWPGELGTHIPTKNTIVIPLMDVTGQPTLIQRKQRVSLQRPENAEWPIVLTAKQMEKLSKEAVEWLENNQMGERRPKLRYGHAFRDWWDKYSADHPDYFAQSPPGAKQPRSQRMKLRLANPEVIEQIAKEYTERGAPDYYNICPNDGFGFDVSEETRAWDIPADQDIQAIWSSEANLTARYVKFWNLVYERLSKINPKVTLLSYAYSAYRFPPPPERPLQAKMILGLVDSYTNFDSWKAWADTGSKLILRPNWWFIGMNAPHIPLAQVDKYLRFCLENNMIAADFDSNMGFWATQGLNYYLTARVFARPDLSKEDIIHEYASAFGAGAPKIEEYIAFWEDLTLRAAYSVPLGGDVAKEDASLFQQIVRKHGISPNAMIGSFEIMPYLYTDEVLEKAGGFLDEAERLAGGGDSAQIQQRINFLRGGLAELKAVRDIMETILKLRQQGKASDAGQNADKQLRMQRENLYRLRQELTPTHAVWGEMGYALENKYHIPTFTTDTNKEPLDLRGE